MNGLYEADERVMMHTAKSTSETAYEHTSAAEAAFVELIFCFADCITGIENIIASPSIMRYIGVS